MFYRCLLAPDGQVEEPRNAGVGIFIFDPGRKLKLFIKACAENCSSVLMAEAITLSLASVISAKLGMQHTNFFTDNQMMQHISEWESF
jgi:hypothetical protein